MTEILVWVAASLGFLAGLSAFLVGQAVGAKSGRFLPAEQMRERTPWPPPRLTQDTGWVTVAYDKPPRREPLALPRGDR